MKKEILVLLVLLISSCISTKYTIDTTQLSARYMSVAIHEKNNAVISLYYKDDTCNVLIEETYCFNNPKYKTCMTFYLSSVDMECQFMVLSNDNVELADVISGVQTPEGYNELIQFLKELKQEKYISSRNIEYIKNSIPTLLIQAEDAREFMKFKL